MTNLEFFRPAEPIEIGTLKCEVRKGVCIRILDDDGDPDYLDSIHFESVADARAFRDWLNKALPDDADPPTGDQHE